MTLLVRAALLLLIASPFFFHADRLTAAFPGRNGKIAFASARDGDFEIYVMNPDASAQTRLTRNAGSDIDPAWSPDGTTIAFTSNDDMNGEIYVMNVDGSGQTRLTSNAGPDSVPAWPPDGLRIAFTSRRDGNNEIYVMNPDGSDQTRLTADGASDVSPAWSPDGSRIAFASDRDGSYEIYAMNADGGSPARLTRNLVIDLDPAWSPDGKSMTFTSDRDANYEIYVMTSDGNAQTRLTTNAFDDTTPDWQPLHVPPTALTRAALSPRWHESDYRGALEVEGSVPGPATLQLILRRGTRVYLERELDLLSGGFQRRFPLPRSLLPGSYAVDVTAEGSATELSPQSVPLVLAGPPEGVVSQAWASTTIGGPPLTRLPPTTSIAYAHFRFAALPNRGRILTATWYYGPKSEPVGEPVPQSRKAFVVTHVRTTNGSPLRRGKRLCILRAGRTVVKRLTFRIS